MKARHASLLIRVVGLPVHFVGRGLLLVFPHKVAHRVISHKGGQIGLGVVVVMSGSALATVEQHVVPHFMWDAAAWLIHGAGCAPLIEHGLSFLAQFVEEEMDNSGVVGRPLANWPLPLFLST